MASFNATLERYKALLAAVDAGRLTLPNENFDIGEPTKAGGYTLCDQAYAQLLRKLDGHYAEMTPRLRQDVLAFYGDLRAPIATKADGARWAEVLKAVEELKSLEQGLSGAPAAPPASHNED